MNPSSLRTLNSLKPMLSVIFIVATLIALVVLKMEERRLGYEMIRLSTEQRKWSEQKRLHEISLTKLTRPQYVQKMAVQKLSMQQVKQGQIVHLQKPPLEENLEPKNLHWLKDEFLKKFSSAPKEIH